MPRRCRKRTQREATAGTNTLKWGQAWGVQGRGRKKVSREWNEVEGIEGPK